MIQIIDEGVLYRNPLPQLRSVHAYFPNILQLSDKEFFCAYSRGSAWVSIDIRGHKLRSVDGGKNWTDEGVIYDGSKDDKPYSYHGNFLTDLKDGTLLCLSVCFDRSDPDKLMYNPETEGYLPVKAALFRSTDRGRTWSLPQYISLPDGEIGNPCGPVKELTDERWLMPFETWKAWDDAGPAKQRTVAIFSGDKGVTWGDRTIIIDGHEEGIIYWDTSITTMKDGRLFCMAWTRDQRLDKDIPLHRCISEDQGKTWSKPESVGLTGHTMSIVELDDRRMLMIYSLRNVERPGIMAVLSNDSGKTFDADHQIRIWDAFGQTTTGIPYSDRCLAEMSMYSFGKPNVLQTTDGSCLAGFWCTQDCVAHIRWCSLMVH